jgi:hypothetical protein
MFLNSNIHLSLTSLSIFAGVSANKIAKRSDLAPNKGGPFAAALRTLAKNAGPESKDGEWKPR